MAAEGAPRFGEPVVFERVHGAAMADEQCRHLGHARPYITFDVVFRYLQHLGYKVRYVRNITDAGHLTDDGDVDNDRFVKQSRLEKLEPMEIVQKYTVDFHKVLDVFNLLPPTIEPTATGHIVEQIELTQKLVEKC